MFPQLKKINNESGVVLFIVLMTSIVMMIYALGILTQSINEMNYAQQQIDQISSEQWSKGAFWNALASNFAGGNQGVSTVIDGRTYFMQINTTVCATDPTINSINVTTNYDTFQ